MWFPIVIVSLIVLMCMVLFLPELVDMLREIRNNKEN